VRERERAEQSRAESREQRETETQTVSKAAKREYGSKHNKLTNDQIENKQKLKQ
jgi:hypothetical protein